jgi:sulfatase modifying factor 1
MGLVGADGVMMRLVCPLIMVLVIFSGYAHAQAGPGGAIRDCPECPEMIMVPGGEFVMGAASGEEDREMLPQEFRHRSDPQRRVKIRPFFVGKFEVTRGQYRAFAGATKRNDSGCFVWRDGDYVVDVAKSWRDPAYVQDDSHPATCVSWNDAQAYVSWLTVKTGKPYRLLTEAEWEYAARGGSAESRFWGQDSRQSCQHANGADQNTVSTVNEAGNWPAAACADGHAHTAPVGSYRANQFGLHDMLGNVAEWTADCWNPDYRGAPSDGSAWMTGNCDFRAVRGGGWDDAPAILRSAYRVGSPVVVRVYARGFRVARQ